MKKITCLLVALFFCLSSMALAESVPSKTTGDLTRFEAVAESQPVDSTFFIRPVAETEVEHQERIEVCQTEISKLVVSDTIETYFGEVKDAEGNAINLKEVLETETLNVFEFCPVIAGDYEEHFGKVVVRKLFSTPYAKDEKVVVMIGLVTVNADGTQTVAWTAYEGIGVEYDAQLIEEMGCIQVELDPEIVLAIQNGTALVAVVSK